MLRSMTDLERREMEALRNYYRSAPAEERAQMLLDNPEFRAEATHDLPTRYYIEAARLFRDAPGGKCGPAAIAFLQEAAHQQELKRLKAERERLRPPMSPQRAAFWDRMLTHALVLGSSGVAFWAIVHFVGYQPA